MRRKQFVILERSLLAETEQYEDAKIRGLASTHASDRSPLPSCAARAWLCWSRRRGFEAFCAFRPRHRTRASGGVAFHRRPIFGAVFCHRRAIGPVFHPRTSTLLSVYIARKIFSLGRSRKCKCGRNNKQHPHSILLRQCPSNEPSPITHHRATDESNSRFVL